MVYNSVFTPSSRIRLSIILLSSFVYMVQFWTTYIVGGGDIDTVVFIDESAWGSCVLLVP